MKTEQANELLPSKPSKAARELSRLKILLMTPPKWGKTSLICSAKDSILLATEEGHLFHEAHKLSIDCWDYPSRTDEEERAWAEDDDEIKHTSMVLAAETLLDSDKFRLVGVDTTDMAAKMCLDYHLARKKVEHASDAGDWGKGWDVTLNKPFRQTMSILMKAGRGIIFTTHLNIVEKKVGGVTVSRYETSLPSGVQKFVHTQCDLLIHGTFGKKRKGLDERDRIVILDGSNEILAGSRVRDVYLPKRFILSPDKSWEQIQGFFDDEELAREADEEYRDIYGNARVELQERDDDAGKEDKKKKEKEEEKETKPISAKSEKSEKSHSSLRGRAMRRR